MSRELLIIGLHRVGFAPPPAKIRGLFISPNQLEFQLTLIREMGFEFATLEQALNQPSGKFAVITFDDGYADNLEAGFPVLKRLGIPATVFVITGDVGKKRAVWSEAGDHLPADLLSWSDLKFLRGEGWEIGSHNCRHVHLARRAAAEQEEFILLSIEEIRRNLDFEPVSFAYPYGDYNPATKNILKKCGIRLAVTTRQSNSLVSDDSTDLLELPRVSLGGEKLRHYFRNFRRLAKATGTISLATALLKTFRLRFSLITNLLKLFQYSDR